MVETDRRNHQQPCADLAVLQQVCRGLVEDWQRQNHSIQRIEANIGELHEKVNGIALLQERELGNLKAQLAGVAASQQALLASMQALRKEPERAEPAKAAEPGGPLAGVNKQLVSVVLALLAVLVALGNALVDMVAKKP